jgi:hypothetical protein
LGKRRRWVGCESSRVPAAACHTNDPPIVVSGYLRSARLAISPGCHCFNTLRPGRTYALVFLIEPISPAKCRRPNPFILINPRRVAKWPAAAPCRMDTPILDGPLKCLALAFGPLKRSRLRSIPRRSMGSNLLAIGAPGFGRAARQIGPQFTYGDNCHLWKARGYPPVKRSSMVLATSSQTAAKSRSSCLPELFSVSSASCRYIAASVRR